MTDDASEMHQAPFREAAGWAADYEMRLRLLAAKTPEIEHTTMARNAQETENAVIAHFEKHLHAGEADAMRTTRGLRNKLLHGDLIEAREKLEELGHPPAQPAVRKLNVDLAGSANPFDDLVAAVKQGGELLTPATHPIEENLLGWLIQSALDGTFVRAGQSFRAGIAIVDRLCMLE